MHHHPVRSLLVRLTVACGALAAGALAITAATGTDSPVSEPVLAHDSGRVHDHHVRYCPAPRDYDGFCSQQVVYAEPDHDPDGLCCQYSSPCAVPGEWEIYSEPGCSGARLDRDDRDDDPNDEWASCPAPRDYDGVCTQVTVTARPADGDGPCCTYGTPCSVPAGWVTYSDDACLDDWDDDDWEDVDYDDDWRDDDEAWEDVGNEQGGCPPAHIRGRKGRYCSRATTWASPRGQGGQCCRYSSPCDVPPGWEAHGDQTCR